MKFVIKLLVLLSFVLPHIAIAQELQVPFDSDARVFNYSADDEMSYRLFANYPGFIEARLFRIEEGRFALEIYYQQLGQIYKKRILMDSAKVEALRKKVKEHMSQQTSVVEKDDDARTRLLVGSMGMGLGYYGWAVPVALDVDDGKVALGLYMLTSGATFLSTLKATRHRPVTDAAATMTIYGATRGVLHGFSLAALLFGDRGSFQKNISLSVIASVSEALWDFNCATRNHMTPGMAESIGFGGDFGIGFGIGAIDLLDFGDNEMVRSMGATVLGCSFAGLMTGKWLARQQPYTRGDAFVVRGMSVLGAYLPLALVDAAGTTDSDPYWAAAMIGGCAGWWTGHRMTRHLNFTTGQGTLTSLGEIAGGLFGLGTAYLISNEDSDNSTLYLGCSAVGATAGFWLMYKAYSPLALRVAAPFSSLNMSVQPGMIPMPGPRLKLMPGIKIEWKL